MALRLRGSKDVKKSFYYVWYLGAREAKGVDAMPGAIAYLLERERLQEPFKVTLQVSGTILKSGFGGAPKISRKRIDDDPCDQPAGTRVDIPIVVNFFSTFSSSFSFFFFPVCPHAWQWKQSPESRKIAKLRPYPVAAGSLDEFSHPIDYGGTNEFRRGFDGALVHFRNVGIFSKRTAGERSS